MRRTDRRRRALPCARLVLAAFGGLALTLAGTGGTQDAAANGDTRTLSFFHTHTQESGTVTFRRDGQYDGAGLKQLNKLLRDWRVEEEAQMDPKIFDILWEIYRESGSRQPIHVISAYRSPQTNAMLRNRSKAVSEHSQHMQGKAMDIRLPDVSTERLREIAMKLQYGGVGYYSSSAFVHVDTGSVRAWPRMTEQQLARLFPDGKTVHLPPSGKPMARYDEARLEVDSRKAALASGVAGPSLGSLFAGLFRKNDPAPAAPAALASAAPAAAPAKPARGIAVASATDDALPAEALSFAPLPPRRPAEEQKAEPIRTAAIGVPVIPAAPAPVAEAATPASRLLFSATPLVTTPRLRPGEPAARVFPTPDLTPHATVASLSVRFSRDGSGTLSTSRFSGLPGRPLPLREARLAL